MDGFWPCSSSQGSKTMERRTPHPAELGVIGWLECLGVKGDKFVSEGPYTMVRLEAVDDLTSLSEPEGFKWGITWKSTPNLPNTCVFPGKAVACCVWQSPTRRYFAIASHSSDMSMSSTEGRLSGSGWMGAFELCHVSRLCSASQDSAIIPVHWPKICSSWQSVEAPAGGFLSEE